MRELRKASGVWGRALFLLGALCCFVGCASSGTGEFRTESTRLVRVKVSGEVYKRGEMMMADGFDLKSFQESVGGFEYGTQFPPSQMVITRLEDGAQKVYRIRFKEMARYQEKGFRFRDGDEVYVPRIVF